MRGRFFMPEWGIVGRKRRLKTQSRVAARPEMPGKAQIVVKTTLEAVVLF